jgi:hypothetical protein
VRQHIFFIPEQRFHMCVVRGGVSFIAQYQLVRDQAFFLGLLP